MNSASMPQSTTSNSAIRNNGSNDPMNLHRFLIPPANAMFQGHLVGSSSCSDMVKSRSPIQQDSLENGRQVQPKRSIISTIFDKQDRNPDQATANATSHQPRREETTYTTRPQEIEAQATPRSPLLRGAEGVQVQKHRRCVRLFCIESNVKLSLPLC